MSKERPTYPLLIESASNYAFTVKRSKENKTFDFFRKVSTAFYRQLPEDIRDELHKSILRGTCMLGSEPELNAYMHDMGKMHNAKLRKAFDNLSENFRNAEVVDVIDYGCGQGLGIIAFADYLRENFVDKEVRRIVLVEPSEMALKRAALHANVLFPNATLVTINKGFDDLVDEDIVSDAEVMTLHILSNVLDLAKTDLDPKGYFDLNRFADLISANLEGENQFVGVEPLFNHNITDEKFPRFWKRVGISKDFKLICNKGEFVTGKNWTCVIVCGTKNNESIFQKLHRDYWEVGELSDGVICVGNLYRGEYGCAQHFYYGYVDELGNDIVPCEYSEAKQFRNGLAFVKNGHSDGDNGWGAINKQGEIVIPYIYESIERADNDEYIIASVEGRIDKYDKNGNLRDAEGRIIEYTSTDGNIVVPHSEEAFDAKIISNTYKNGVGKIIFDKPIAKIGEKAFEYCYTLKSIVIPDSVVKIGDGAFESCTSLKNISIPDNVINIGGAAFQYCTSLQSAIIGKGVKEISEASFDECSSLVDITIPEGVMEVEPFAFSGCKALKKLEFPNSITKVYYDAFTGCESLVSVKFGKSLRILEENPFDGCRSLKQIVVNRDSMPCFEPYADEWWSKLIVEADEFRTEYGSTTTLQLYSQQQQALDAICEFLKSEDQVFILKGYAGTGKTTMIKAMLPILHSMGKQTVLMAPTGRAAKVLMTKTGENASTIHRTIYSVNRLTSVRHDENGELIKMVDYIYKDKEEVRKHDVVEFWFGINQDRYADYNPQNAVYIVDEASMVSSRKTTNELFHFGSDVLLDDLLEYAELLKGGKVIFIGDPAQLPPVGDNYSAALSEEYFKEKDISVVSFELTDVVRQAADSVILENAMMLRDLLQTQTRNTLTFKRCDNEVEDVLATTMVAKYIEMYPEPSFGDTAIICYSNKMAKGYNDAIRSYYYPGEQSVQAGDILQVVKNYYRVDEASQSRDALYNGDFVRVLDVSSDAETQSAPVWTKPDNKREVISLQFRDVSVQTENGDIYKLKIIDSLLNSTNPGLTPNEHIALYINFRMRNPNLPKDKEAQAKMLMEDPYYNALNVKYGYAITGPKSQGGDWDAVFVDYDGRTGLDNDSLRWMYTATTRAKKILYGVNMPNIQPFDKLQFRPITKLNKPAANAQIVGNVGNVDMLSSNASASQKAKCLSVISALDCIGYKVDKIEQLQYKDRYHIRVNDVVEKYDCTYNGAGYYTAYNALNASEHSNAIIGALQSEESYTYQFDYLPSHKVLEDLHAKMRSICDELGVSITNIVEDIKQYNVAYFLKTTGKYSYIKFYFDKNMFVTYGHPYSDIESEDILLNEVITKLS